MSGQAKQQTTPVQIYQGLAAEDLIRDSVELKVIVPGLSPASLDGEFAPGTTKLTTSLTNLSGVKESHAVTTANHIIATWYGERNVATAPMVRQGEQVEILQYSDSDKYFWRPTGRDRNFHQTDRLRMEVGATTDKNSDKTDLNTYFFELDSDGKKVQFKTSKVNGEPFAWTFCLDTATSQFTLTDDSDKDTPNRILIDSKSKIIQLNNSKGTTIQINDQDITIFAPRDILMHAGRQVFIDSPLVTFNRSSQGVIMFNADSISAATNTTTFNTTSFGVSGASKLVGPVVLGPTRTQSIITGPVGSAYPPATGNYHSGEASNSTASPDTTTTSSSNRHAAAQEDVASAFDATVTCLTTLAAKVGVSINTGPITDSAASSKIKILQGE